MVTNGNKVWFGNLRMAQWVPAPAPGFRVDSLGSTEGGATANGGAFVSNSPATHRSMSMSWPQGQITDFQFLMDYRNGIYGTGLCYLVDPMWADVNAMPPHWARPELVDQGWPSLLAPDAVAMLSDMGLVYTNLATNPSFETAVAGTDVVRTNRSTNPAFRTNESGWNAWAFGAGVAGTGSRLSGDGPDGDWYRRVTITTVGNGGFSTSAALSNDPTDVVPGLQITQLIWIRSSHAVPVQVLTDHFVRSSATYVSSSGAPLVTLVPNVWTEVWVTSTVPASATASRIRIDVPVNAVTQVGTTFDIARYLAEDGPYSGPYFDGNTANALGFVYSWEGAANASASVAKAATVEVRRNHVMYPNAEANTNTGWSVRGSGVVSLSTPTTNPHSGTRSYQVVCDGAASSQGVNLNPVSGVVSTGSAQDTLSVWVLAPSGATLTYTVEEYTPASTYVGNLGGLVPLTATGAWQRISRSVTKSAAVNIARILVQTAGAQAITFYVDDAFVEPGTTLNDYFDGSFPPAGDFSYRWEGAANASVSTQRGVGIVGAWYGSSRVAFQSKEWSQIGGSSLRIVAANGTGVNAGALVGPLLTPGKCYTVGGVYRATAAGGSTEFGARSLWINTTTSGAGIPQRATAPDGAGTTEVRLTLKIESNHDSQFRAGGNGVGVDAWWDALTVVEVPSLDQPYTGPLFDGNSHVFADGTKSAWLGTPDASQSTLPFRPATGPSKGAEYTLTGDVNAVPHRQGVLLIPPTQTLWIGFVGTAANGGTIRIQPVRRDGLATPYIDATLINPMSSTRLNHSFSGDTFSAVRFYMTSTLLGTSIVTLLSSKAVYANIGTTPQLTGAHEDGRGHSGMRFSSDPTFAYSFYDPTNVNGPRKYASAAADFTEVGAWL